MKKLLLILSLFMLACNGREKQNKPTDNVDLTETEKIKSVNSSSVQIIGEIEAAKKFSFKNLDRPIDDTLILKVTKGTFEISPTGLLRTIKNDSIQLQTDLIVQQAFLYEDLKYFYLFYTETDYEGATSWVEKISKNPLKAIYSEQIQGFNLGQPIIQNNFAYVTTIGFVGKIDLKTGIYEWKHYNLYDREKYSFNSFDTILIKKNTTEFLSKNYKSEKLDKVIIDNQTGEIKQIEK